MRKQITYKFEDKEYILEYTRESVQFMEARGFRVTEIDAKPATSLPMLFEGAFRVHHPSVTHETVEKIFDSIRDRKTLFAKLAEMYLEPITTLMEDPEGDEGNAGWKANW